MEQTANKHPQEPLVKQVAPADLQAEIIERLTKENLALRGKDLTVPMNITVTTIKHQPDPKTKEVISSTIRQDHGFQEVPQKFNGRQP